MSAQGGLYNIFDEKKCGQISSVTMEFDGEFLPKIIEATQNFWEEEFEFRVFDVNNNERVKEDLYLEYDSFFISQVPSKHTPPVTIRLSDEFIRLILHNTFGSDLPLFELSDLSELEIRILNGYCDFIYKSFAKLLTDEDELNKFELKNKEVYNFVIIIKNKDEKISKIVITLPSSRIKRKEIQKEQNYSDDEFKNINAYVDIEAGSSKITLNDLKNISQGDIMLLEDSFVNKMKIITGEKIREFKINPDPELMIEIDEDEHDIEGEENTNTNMWDDIQIEVNARFKKIKMTLGELKHISKGLVIDLGSVFHNEISLLVEEKTVAKGELVIINDKYAVKINEIISDMPKQPQVQPKQQAQAQKVEQQAQKPQAQKAQGASQAQPKQQTQAQKPKAQRPQGAAAAQRPQATAQRPQAAAQRPQAAAKKDEVEEDFDYSDFEEDK